MNRIRYGKESMVGKQKIFSKYHQNKYQNKYRACSLVVSDLRSEILGNQAFPVRVWSPAMR